MVPVENTKYTLSPKLYASTIQEAQELPQSTKKEVDAKDKAFGNVEKLTCTRQTWEYALANGHYNNQREIA